MTVIQPSNGTADPEGGSLQEATIYALKGSSEWCDMLSSLQAGEGRFGWSYCETANLRELKQRIEDNGWTSLTEQERDCNQSFLLDLNAGDYVVYVNVPEWGKCTLAKVNGPYEWRFDDDDFNHRFPVDPDSVRVFDRNDAIVHPALRTRLKLPGRRWRISLKEEFEALLRSLHEGVAPRAGTREDSLRFLSSEIEPFLSDITTTIHHTHPRADLEGLVAEVFRHVPGVRKVTPQGGAGDHGADILVHYASGLDIPGLADDGLLVVQVKSYEGGHSSAQAVDDIRRAYEHYPEASMGLIVSTAATSTPELDSALDTLIEESGKPLALLIGPDVAAFLLRFGANMLG